MVHRNIQHQFAIGMLTTLTVISVLHEVDHLSDAFLLTALISVSRENDLLSNACLLTTLISVLREDDSLPNAYLLITLIGVRRLRVVSYFSPPK